MHLLLPLHPASACSVSPCTLPPALAIDTPPFPSGLLLKMSECLTLGTGLNLQAQPCLRANCPASLSTLS